MKKLTIFLILFLSLFSPAVAYSQWHADSPFNIKNGKNITSRSPFFNLISASGNYTYDYRSFRDTPLLENYSQHQIQGNFSVLLKEKVPIDGYLFIRKANSRLFRDIYDVRLKFDAVGYTKLKEDILRKKLTSQIIFKDSITEKLLRLKENEFNKLYTLQASITDQKIIEAYEIIRIPESTYNFSVSDSANKNQYDSLKRSAILLIDKYESLKAQLEKIKSQKDSLKICYEKSVKEMQDLQQIIQSKNTHTILSDSRIRKRLPSIEGLGQNYWLANVKSFSVGKSFLNSSELTARNIPLTGFQIEYNSWYYLSIAAGIIDYRFQDFLKDQRVPRQYLTMLRLGLGRIENSYFILSYFMGRKQTASVGSSRETLPVTGITMQGKWQLLPNGYLLGEIGQTMSANPMNPAIKSRSWSFSDKSNKGISTQFSYLSRRIQIEARYRFIGINYQGFYGFRSNAEQMTWSIKYNQKFFNQRLKLAASVSRNDFQNAYTIHYHTNSIFKTLTVTATIPRLPTVSVGYLPLSQIIAIDSLLVEDRYQTFQASLNHFYRVGEVRSSTSLFYTKFFKKGPDSASVFFNASSFFATQSFFFHRMNISVGVSMTKNRDYDYTVFDESLTLPISKRVNLGFGAKINQLNFHVLKTGGYFNGDISFPKGDILSFRIEQSYLPSSKGTLHPYPSGTFYFSKIIK